MSVEEYFSTIIWILMGLAFVAISLIFLYMIYGEKEETNQSTGQTKAVNAVNNFLKFTNKISMFL
jgi:flagellar basal body-associated protein FliL